MNKLNSIFIFFFFIFVWSCKNSKELAPSGVENDEILAEVGKYTLYKSEIENLIPSESDAEDSIRVLKGLVNNWIKDQLMILEAEKNMPKDININKMIEDYRASLLLYNYETKLSDELLDTLITDAQKKVYYDTHADEYILSESIGKYMIAKLPLKTKGADNFFEHWRKGNNSEIESYCKTFAKFHDLDRVSWKPVGQLLSFIPSNLLTESNLGRDKSFRKKDKEFEYFIKIYDFHKKGTQPPFEYIESKIVKILLNERKSGLIKQKKQQLFDKEAGSSKVKNYTI